MQTRFKRRVDIRRFALTAAFAIATALPPLVATAQLRDTSDASSTVSWLRLAFEQRGRIETLTNRFYDDGEGASRTLAVRSRIYAELREVTDPLRFVIETQDSRGTFADTPSLSARTAHE